MSSVMSRQEARRLWVDRFRRTQIVFLNRAIRHSERRHNALCFFQLALLAEETAEEDRSGEACLAGEVPPHTGLLRVELRRGPRRTGAHVFREVSLDQASSSRRAARVGGLINTSSRSQVSAAMRSLDSAMLGLAQ